jgi:cyanate permease
VRGLGPTSASPRRWTIEAILFFSYVVFSVSWLAISPLAPAMMGWFHVTKAEFALLNTVVAATKVVGSIVAAAVAVRVGVKNTIMFGSALIVFGVLGPLFPSFHVFLVSRALFGLGGAVLVTLVPAMVVQWFPATEVSVVNGVNGVASNTGFALALMLTVPLSRTALGWRGTLVLFSVMSAALFLLWALFGRENRASVAGSTESVASGVGFRDVWRRKETWLITMGFTGAVVLYLTLAFWLPTYYQQQFHFDMARAARSSAVINLTGVPSAVIGGLLAQRTGARRPFLIIGGLLFGTASFGTFLVASPAWILVSAMVVGVGLFITIAPLTTLLMELEGTTPRQVALISGTMMSVSYLFNSIVPNIVGWIGDRTGSFVPGFLMVSVFSWTMVLAGFLLPETGPRARRSEPQRRVAPVDGD